MLSSMHPRDNDRTLTARAWARPVECRTLDVSGSQSMIKQTIILGCWADTIVFVRASREEQVGVCCTQKGRKISAQRPLSDGSWPAFPRAFMFEDSGRAEIGACPSDDMNRQLGL
jgi:hypothetical protein